METTDIAIYRGLGAVRNYGVVVLMVLFALHGLTLGALHWIESNDVRTELVNYMETIPVPDINQSEQMINLPEKIIVLRSETDTRVGFYETSIGGQDYLAYANPEKHYILMESEEEIQKEVMSFAIALGALYLGELFILLGWWFFIRSKVREIFEAM